MLQVKPPVFGLFLSRTPLRVPPTDDDGTESTVR
jgi:hypothetical protein